MWSREGPRYEASRWQRLLIVDDSAIVRRTVGSALLSEGFNVCGEANNGQEAVEQAVLNSSLFLQRSSLLHERSRAVRRSRSCRTPAVFGVHHDRLTKHSRYGLVIIISDT